MKKRSRKISEGMEVQYVYTLIPHVHTYAMHMA